MAITTRAGFVAAHTTPVRFYKANVPGAVERPLSLFRAVGMPAAATAPGTASGQTLSRTSTGALPIPPALNTSYISSFRGASATSSGTLILADRLVETGTLSGIVTSAQTVNSVALPTRASSATDVELWLELYTAIGSTASPSVTASYTNSSGTSGRTATLVGGFPSGVPPTNRSYQMALQEPDTGVQSVQSVTFGTSTGTAGAFGVVLRRCLLLGAVGCPPIPFRQGWAETDLQICADDACLELLFFNGSAASGVIQGSLDLLQG